MPPIELPTPRPDSRTDRRNVISCVALFLLAAAVANPLLERGINDAWAYTQIARSFALTGHFTYNGWTAAMLLPQLVWGALFIKLFGFSFLAVRLSTVILAVLLIPLLYRLGRESGLAPSFAVFVTLLTILSPLVMPEAVTFMSDVPALFLFALSFYGGVRSWKAGGTKACVAWAWLAALAGVLGGLDRQFYWIAPLSSLPIVAWIQRRQRGAARGIALAWLATVVSIGGSMVWYLAKPYTLSEHPLHTLRTHIDRAAGRSVHVAFLIGMTAGLVLLPLLAGYVAPGFQAVSRRLAALVLGGVATVTYVMAILCQCKMPAMGNILTEYGICPPGVVAIGDRPLILGPVARDLLTFAVLLCMAGCGLALWKHRGEIAARLRDDPATPATALGLTFVGVYLAGVVFRAIGTPSYDRYAIPLLPILGIPLLRHYQLCIRPRISRWSWAVLTLFALYGVATTHDEFAAGRAQLTATRTLEQAGIPRTGIRAGFEYDGWTQVESAGYVNNYQIEKPAGAYRKVTCTGPPSLQPWWAPYTPAVRARYFVMLSRSAELVDAPAGPVAYTTWLPPARRQMYIQILPDGRYAECR